MSSSSSSSHAAPGPPSQPVHNTLAPAKGLVPGQAQAPTPTPALRPLLPSQPSPSDQGSPSLGQQQAAGRHDKPKRILIAVACDHCRKRKNKCDGGRPTCGPCAVKGIACQYESGPDRRKTALLRQRNEALELDLSQFRQLHDLLRNLPETEAIDLLRVIRTGLPPAEILARPSASDGRPASSFARSDAGSGRLPSIRSMLLSHEDLQRAQNYRNPSSSQSPKFPFRRPSTSNSAGQVQANDSTSSDLSSAAEEDQASFASQLSRHRNDDPIQDPTVTLYAPGAGNASITLPDSYHDIRLHDNIFYRAAAQHWTDVTADSPLIARLLAIYFTWEHPLFPFFDKSAFLQDMAEGKSTYCSRAMVNAVLAKAYQNYPVDGVPRWNPMHPTSIFCDEAVRLWKEEQRENTLTGIQTGLILMNLCICDGSDKEGFASCFATYQMAKDLGIFRRSQDQHFTLGAQDEVKMRRSRDITAWAMFAFQSFQHMHLHTDPMMRRAPLVDIPAELDEDLSDAWPSYNFAPRPARTIKTFQLICTLALIINDISQWLFNAEQSGNQVHIRPPEAELFHGRLRGWFTTNADCFQAPLGSLPHIMMVHQIYLMTVVQLFRPLLANLGPTINLEGASMHVNVGMSDLKILLDRYGREHGWRPGYLMIGPSLLFIAFDTLRMLGDRQSRYFFAMSVKALGELSDFTLLPLLQLQTVYRRALEHHISMPYDIAAIFERVNRILTTTTAAQLVRSRYPTDLDNIYDNIDHSRVDYLIQEMQLLRTDVVA